jgi:hypothetical protein
VSLISLEAWENIISSHLNGVPQPTLVDAVRDALIDFCQKTRIWSEPIAVEFVAGERFVYLPNMAGTAFPFEVSQRIIVDGTPINLLDKAKLEAKYPSGWSDLVGEVECAFSDRPGRLILIPAPEQNQDIEATAFYQPSRNGLEAPLFLYEMYANIIGYKAIAILHGHELASYAKADKIGEFESRYQMGLDSVYNREGVGFSTPRLQTFAHSL